METTLTDEQYHARLEKRFKGFQLILQGDHRKISLRLIKQRNFRGDHNLNKPIVPLSQEKLRASRRTPARVVYHA